MADEKDWVPFPLRVSGGDGVYRVDVVSKDPRVPDASEEIRLSSEELADLRSVHVSLLQQASQRARDARAVRLLPASEARPLDAESFSKKLTEKVFQGSVKSAFVRAAAVTNRVAVSLKIPAHDLAGLPWELLRDPEALTMQYLAREPHRRLVRVSECRAPAARSDGAIPVVLVVAVARHGLWLDFGRERQALEALKALGLVELYWLQDEEATFRRVHDVLAQGEVRLFHFAGHGSFDEAGSKGAIELHDGAVQADRLSMLFRESGVRLAFLNSCQGATSARADAFASTAQHLAEAKVGAVLAMQHVILDGVAGQFAADFYHHLGSGESVTDAVNATRRLLSEPGAPADAWATPVLYLNGEDGALLARRGPSDATPHEALRTARRRRNVRLGGGVVVSFLLPGVALGDHTLLLLGLAMILDLGLLWVVIAYFAPSASAVKTASTLKLMMLAVTAVLGAFALETSKPISMRCPPPAIECRGACVDPRTDNAHCGDCGRPCHGAETCDEGRCALRCAPGMGLCGGTCVDPRVDGSHCGQCGVRCDEGRRCVAGRCELDCAAGLTSCGDVCVDLMGDASNCGRCGNACPPSRQCTDGGCPHPGGFYIEHVSSDPQQGPRCLTLQWSDDVPARSYHIEARAGGGRLLMMQTLDASMRSEGLCLESGFEHEFWVVALRQDGREDRSPVVRWSPSVGQSGP